MARKKQDFSREQTMLYGRRKLMEWMLPVLREGIELNEDVLKGIDWALGGLEGITAELQAKLASSRKKEDRDALEKIREGLSDGDEPYEIFTARQFAKHHPNVLKRFTDALIEKAGQLTAYDVPAVYAAPRRLSKKLFALSRDELDLCELAFHIRTFRPVERLLEDEIEVERFPQRHILALMLGISTGRLAEIRSRLDMLGIMDMDGSLNLSEAVMRIWLGGGRNALERSFRTALPGTPLPLKDFELPDDAVAIAGRLITQKDSSPVSLLLYGPPGTGKTSFIHSLAHEYGIQVWSVPCRDDDSERDRRCSLTACLNITKEKGRLVLVDEAERLLSTDAGRGQDKAWINSILEKEGHRIVWITNHPEMIDSAVKRRFSYSIYFRPLSSGASERAYSGILRRQGSAGLLDPRCLAEIAETYAPPVAVFNSAAGMAARLQGGPLSFEQILRNRIESWYCLQTGSDKAPELPKAGSLWSAKGVSIEGSPEELLRKTRRIDRLMRDSKAGAGASDLPAGCAAMLFYGPPGTGKTAFARHIAEELGRPCMVRRASDLLSPYVGMTEQQIAHAFDEAERKGAVLVIDEADSFLFSRDNASHSWEGTMVNEFLTRLEECRCFCVCTTNRMAEFDPAAIRRFSFKIGFGWSTPAQAMELYRKHLAPFADRELSEAEAAELSSIRRLAPGDFHTVHSKLWMEEPNSVPAGHIISLLRAEADLKSEKSVRRIGFSIS